MFKHKQVTIAHAAACFYGEGNPNRTLMIDAGLYLWTL